MHSERQDELLNGYCSGSLSEKEFQELEKALRADQALRRRLVEFRMLDSDLRASSSVTLPFPHTEQDEGSHLRSPLFSWIALAAAACLTLSIIFLPEEETPSNPSTPTSYDPGVAVLTQGVDALWSNSDVRVGDSIAPGNWELLAGTAELEFYNGASVTLEAPASLEVVSENGGVLHHGKLRAHVPHHAQGFTITTKEIELVDLGTSFGMEVSEDKGTEVHVFDGKVELFEPDSGRIPGEGIELLAGDGRKISATQEVSSLKAEPNDFLSAQDLRTQEEQAFQQWQLTSRELKNHTDLIAAYFFEKNETSPRLLSNRSSIDTPGIHGSIIGASWSTGRWPQKQSIDFKRPGDRVKIDIPGNHQSVTLATWVRIDGFDNQFHSLLLSDGWNHLGALHWQVHKEGFIELAIQNQSKVTNNSRTPFVMQPSDFGRWMQLSTVYDGVGGEVHHYLNGQCIGTVSLPVTVPVHIGLAEIGNWTPGKGNREVRNFNGRMDELLIFKKALSPREIANLYTEQSL